MTLFTAIGLALGAGASIAAATGAAAVIGAAAIGTGAYALSGGFDKKGGGVDSRIAAAVGTGGLSEAEAQIASKRRAFRSGILFTSPTGLDSDPRTSSARLR